MATRISGSTIREVHSLFRWGALGTWTDSQLMALFVTGQEGSEAAFRVLIHRHGPMVLGVCRRVLGDEHAAEDAFQATFLVMVRKAGTLRDRDLLTNWLYGVALRVARKEKARGARRRAVERRAVEQAARQGGDLDAGELRVVIDEEIGRLPERYRVPWVLCHLEGLRHDEVARRLGCPVGTVESRLSRARERLRARLARRGLAPSASVLSVALTPPQAGWVPPALLEATLHAVIDRSARQAGFAVGMAWRWMMPIGHAIPRPIAGAVTTASALVIGAGILTISLGFFPAESDPPRSPSTPQPPPPASSRTAVMGSPSTTTSPANRPPPPTPSPESPPTVVTPPGSPPPRQRRSPVAVARPLSGITIDGRLDDWPSDLTRYRIDHQLLDHGSYDHQPRDRSHDLDAYFLVGYDRRSQRIYLAAVVRDDTLMVHSASREGPGTSGVLTTDAVEVYVDGNFSERRIPLPAGDWRETLDAATMPVLQYVGVPSQVGAYGDPWGANPSLVYGRTREPSTKMSYRREGDVTTYEWAIQAYDQYPDRPTRLVPGKSLGFDVAVVDKDAIDRRPAWTIWGSTRGIYKGCNAASLGELILADEP